MDYAFLDSLGTKTERDELAAFCARALPLGELKRRFFISGASGLLGSRLALALLWLNSSCGCNFHITAMSRSREKLEKVFGGESEALSFYVGDIKDPVDTDGNFDYIVHAASETSSAAFVSRPVDTINTALRGTENMLKLARSSGAKLLYLSSLEIYGETDRSLVAVRESDGGYIDPLSPRSSYSEGKRLCECLCASYARQYGVSFCSARLTQSFGPGVLPTDSRVFAQFCRSAIEGKDIELHTSGGTVRNYCAAIDAVSAFLYILARGKSGEAYNVANMDTAVSIRELAELAARLFPEKKLRVYINSAAGENRGYNPEMIIKLSSVKLEALGWRALLGLEEMLSRTARSMMEFSGDL